MGKAKNLSQLVRPIEYDSTTNITTIKSGASDTTAVTIDASQNATLAGTLTVPGAISASGGVVGAVTGNASTATALSTASGSAPSYSARAWVNFNGTGTVAINASGNVSSITDNGVGNYTVNFTTALPDANYAVVGSINNNNSSCGFTPTALATGTTRIVTTTVNPTTSYVDFSIVTVSIFR